MVVVRVGNVKLLIVKIEQSYEIWFKTVRLLKSGVRKNLQIKKVAPLTGARGSSPYIVSISRKKFFR